MVIQWSGDCKKCVDSTPLVLQDVAVPCVVIGSHAARIFCFALETGHLLWSTGLPNRIESSCVFSSAHNLVYVGCYDGSLYALQVGSGEIAWQFKTKDMIKCTPAIDSIHQLCWFGSYDQHLYGVQLSDGILKYQRKLSGSIYARPVVDAFAKNSIVYVATTAGFLHALDVCMEERWLHQVRKTSVLCQW